MFRFSSFVLIAAISAIGCQNSNTEVASPDPAPADSSPAATAQTNADTTAQQVVIPPQPVVPHADLAPPEKIVQAFLDALRNGDEKVAAGLLTKKAHEETAKNDLVVQPPGTPSATYKVGRVDFVTEKKDGAHVSSQWTESDGQGNSESYEVIWVLRKQTDGWRIAGMATQMAPDEQPLFLNFENPVEMLRKWEAADAEFAKKQEAAAAELAKKPAATNAPQQQP